MATLETDERNIIEGEEINWRLIVYPVLLVLIVVVGGIGFYFHHLSQINEAEESAATALAAAKTPEDMAKVADQYPDTTQASVALMSAADASFAKKDYATALKDYQRVTSESGATEALQDSAQLGVGSVQEASGKPDDAIQSYLVIAHKGNQSPFAATAFHQVAAIYASRQDKTNEVQILQQTVSLGGDSPFVREAQAKLQALAPPPPAPATSGAPKP